MSSYRTGEKDPPTIPLRPVRRGDCVNPAHKPADRDPSRAWTRGGSMPGASRAFELRRSNPETNISAPSTPRARRGTIELHVLMTVNRDTVFTYSFSEKCAHDGADLQSSGRVMNQHLGSHADYSGSDLVLRHGATQDLEIWYAEVRKTFSYGFKSDLDRQLIYLPGEGQVVVRTKHGEYVCDATRGFNVSTSEVISIESQAGRTGYAMTVSHRALARRHAMNPIPRVSAPADFLPQFELEPGAPRPLAKLAKTALSPELSPSLQSSARVSQSIVDALIDLVIETLPRRSVDHRPPLPAYLMQARLLLAGDEPVLTVDYLAQKCGVSVRALQYGFREHLRITPVQAVKQARLEKAREAIARTPSLPLIQAVRRYGFTNLSRFRRAFEEVYGEAPLAYQQRLRRR